MPLTVSVQCEMNAILNRLVQGAPQAFLAEKKKTLLAHVGKPSTFDPTDATDLLKYLVVDCGVKPQGLQVTGVLSSCAPPAEAYASGIAPVSLPDRTLSKTGNLLKDNTVGCGRWVVSYHRRRSCHKILFAPRADLFENTVFGYEPQGMFSRVYALFHRYRLSFHPDGSPGALGQYFEHVMTVRLPYLCFQQAFSGYLPVKRPATPSDATVATAPALSCAPQG